MLMISYVHKAGAYKNLRQCYRVTASTVLTKNFGIVIEKKTLPDNSKC